MKESSILGIVHDLYGLQGQLRKLDGQDDFNYKLEAKNGNTYLVKISKTGDEGYFDFQYELLAHLADAHLPFAIPEPILNNNKQYVNAVSLDNKQYYIRMHTWVEGVLLSEKQLIPPNILKEWSSSVAHLSSALDGFSHPKSHRYDVWNILNVEDSFKYIVDIKNEDNKELAIHFQAYIESSKNLTSKLRQSINYADAHQQNILLGEAGAISGIIDFGDAIYGPTISDLAIALAYACMGQEDILGVLKIMVKKYHAVFPIKEEELSSLYLLVVSRLMITTLQAAKNYKLDPENRYHQVSANPAWEVLRKMKQIHPHLFHYTARYASGLDACPHFISFKNWTDAHLDQWQLPVEIVKKSNIDLSVNSEVIPHFQDYQIKSRFDACIEKYLEENNVDLAIGGYGEIRPFYTTPAYVTIGNHGPRWRTVHLGEDYWAVHGTPVYACCDGEVISVFDNDYDLDYGPTIIVKHEVESNLTFYSLYGHLSRTSLKLWKEGQKINKGDLLGYIGKSNENGGWPPHLHFQIMLDMLHYKENFPGLSYFEDAPVWMSICPSLQHPFRDVVKENDSKINRIIKDRSRSLGRNMSVSYDDPLLVLRGVAAHLLDSTGRRYLDTVNNVAHVGHEHPHVVHRIVSQASKLNTNTRYLHPDITQYATRLLSYAEGNHKRVFLVNSGSEANELALRIARTHTNKEKILAFESGYHGNTGNTIAVSSYKFDGKGGHGRPAQTCLLPFNLVNQNPQDILDAIFNEANDNIAGFIGENILSCAGQIVPESSWIQAIYEFVKSKGGVTIADEVQTGLGRVGSHFWAYQIHGVVPDIITLGKPIGNGHPLGAVIVSEELAESFDNGMEYFNTFGGNPVSVAAGMAVLDVIEQEHLQAKAQKIGKYLIEELNVLKQDFTIISDVRGRGLFLGVELIKDEKPATAAAKFIVNEMRSRGVLMSYDGPHNNVLKIKPPMIINKSDVDLLIGQLRFALIQV